MKNRYNLFVCWMTTALCWLTACTPSPTDSIDLSGTWQVQLDSASTSLIQLPGTTDIAGLGEPNRLVPEMTKPQLLHLTRRHAFVGEACYTKEVEIPARMAGKPLRLLLERTLWQSRLFVDDREVGAPERSLVAPHRHNIPEGLSTGRHLIQLRIDNRKLLDISVKDLCHSYTNDTQVMWNGVLGEMSLSVVPEVEIDHIEIYPDVEKRELQVHTYLNEVQAPLSYRLDGQFMNVKAEETLADRVVATLALPEEVKPWSEFSPELHTLTVGGEQVPAQSATFGLREIANEQGKLCINGAPIFLRGTLECCVFPLTGNPPTGEEEWEQLFRTAQEWGLNHLRFHSWCPPDAAFRVADRLGFYLAVELPVWSLMVGDDPEVCRFMEEEFEQIVRHYGNHPSLCMLSCGNELQHDFDFLNSLVAHMKRRDPRRLYITTSFTFEPGHGGHNEPEDEYYVTQWTDKGWVRGQGVFDEEPPSFCRNYDSAMGCLSVPLISHEIGQYAVYPDLKEIEQYTGSLLPLNLMAIRRDLEQKGLLDRAEEWLQASGHLAAILYKEECERAMKTRGFSGYQLLGLQDFPGQGTALIGLVNAFWQSKHIVEAEWFRQFCAPVVPLANFEKAVWSNGETFTAEVQVANYTPQPLEEVTLRWALTDRKGDTVATGTLPTQRIPMGDVYAAGSFSTPLQLAQAEQLTLSLEMEGTPYHNEWPIWVYPKPKHPQGVTVTADLDEAIARLTAGEKVLLSPRLGTLKGIEGKFLPVFWSPVHFPKQAGTMGIVCHPEHPALAEFPTEMWGNWQWWRLAKRSTVLCLDSLQGFTPLVEQVDNFVRNRRLATVMEARCGGGTLLLSAIDLLSAGAESPELEQMLYSLECYLASDSWAPQGEVSVEQLRSLFQGKASVTATKATSIYE